MTIYSGQGRERLITATAATSDANGLITFRVGPCPLGFVWQGSVTITGAPSGALLNASVASTPWGQWAGPTNFGPVQLWGNETLVVTGGGLLPSTQYSMLFFGVAMPDSMAEPVPPVAPLSMVSVETTTLLLNRLAWSGPVVITPPTLTRRLTIVARSTGGAIGTVATYTVVGNTSGARYGTFTVVNGSTTRETPQFIEIEPSIDPTYTIDFSSGASGSYELWVLASTTNPLIATNPSTPLVTLPAFGVFSTQFDIVISPLTANQGLIGTPAAGQSITLQQVTSYALRANGPVAFSFHPSGSTQCIGRSTISSTGTEQLTWPGGYQLPAATGLQVDAFFATTAALLIATGTYTVGPTL